MAANQIPLLNLVFRGEICSEIALEILNKEGAPIESV